MYERLDDQTSVQDDAEGPELCRPGARTARQTRRRQPLWQRNRVHAGGLYSPRRIAFPAIQGPLPANVTAEDFLKLFIHEGIIDHLVRETNLYAQQYITKGDNLRPPSSARN